MGGLLLFSLSCKLGPNEEDPVPMQPQTSVADAHENVVGGIFRVIFCCERERLNYRDF